MSTWFQIASCTETIYPIEVVREEGNEVVLAEPDWLGRHQVPQFTTMFAICQTRQECWQWLIDKRKEARDEAQRKLDAVEKLAREDAQ